MMVSAMTRLAGIPTAYPQTRSPNGLRFAATVAITPTHTRRRVALPPSFPALAWSQARATTTGPRMKLPCTLAQAITISGIHHNRSG